MQIDPSLIKRFLNNECTGKERELVARYLDEHPEALDHFLGEAEWESFDTAEQLPEQRSAQMKRAVMQHAVQHSPAPRRLYARLAVAATVCVLIVAAAWYLLRPPAVNNIPAAAPRAGNWIVLENSERNDRSIRMPDGSLVVLAPGARMRYPRAFAGQRSVELQGDALFDVAPDHLHPFRVKTGQLAITVLGTRFKVYAGDSARNVRVKLFSGKVRIGAWQEGAKVPAPVELQPGRELVYRQGQAQWEVRDFDAGKKARRQMAAGPDAAEERNNGDALVFEHQPLPAVLARLQQHFNTPVQYKGKNIQQYYFSGEFMKTDSLIHILNTIGALNGLEVKEAHGGYLLQPAGK